MGDTLATFSYQGDKAAAHYGQLGAHARSEGLIAVANNMKEFVRTPGARVENRV
jgi:tRNA(fMet)-specific endonuclease VapC